jgi:putative PIN family toxin of toxin-antitoxin system
MNLRTVTDTNVYVSRALRPESVPARAVEKAWLQAKTLISAATWAELQIVLRRPKFARYIPAGAIEPFLEKVQAVAGVVEIGSSIRACRDPRDDKFLEVAVHGRADPHRGPRSARSQSVSGNCDCDAGRVPRTELGSSPGYPECIMTLNQTPTRRVAVYCGSANGTNPAFLAEAQALGAAIAAAGLSLVYGGASVGLMGAVADAALAGGAHVTGVLPDVLAGKEIAHNGLTSLELVATMHIRKARMAELADAFLVLPGGYGTLEELLEAVTWAQLRLHDKPCILINTAGYWDGFLTFLDTAVAAGFLKEKNRALMLVAAGSEDAIRQVFLTLGRRNCSSANQGV